MPRAAERDHQFVLRVAGLAERELEQTARVVDPVERELDFPQVLGGVALFAEELVPALRRPAVREGRAGDVGDAHEVVRRHDVLVEDRAFYGFVAAVERQREALAVVGVEAALFRRRLFFGAAALEDDEGVARVLAEEVHVHDREVAAAVQRDVERVRPLARHVDGEGDGGRVLGLLGDFFLVLLAAAEPGLALLGGGGIVLLFAAEEGEAALPRRVVLWWFIIRFFRRRRRPLREPPQERHRAIWAAS